MAKRHLSAGTDWERVKREAATNAPIPHAATDGPYDPNDTAAVSAYWQHATVTRGHGGPPVSVKRQALANELSRNSKGVPEGKSVMAQLRKDQRY